MVHFCHTFILFNYFRPREPTTMPLAHSTKHYVVEDPEATVRASAISPAVEGAVADTGAEEAPTA